MTTRTIGTLTVPPVGLGCNSLGTWADADTSVRLVHAALDAGATLFDTADYYGSGTSEQVLGRALADRRDQAVVATKFGVKDRSLDDAKADPDFVRAALDASLQRLGMDHVDLYQLHFPDPTTPVEDTMGVLAELVAAGKVREIGICNVDATMVDQWVAAASGTTAVACVQAEWSLVRRRIEDEVVPACRRHDLPILPYFPLASGLLTGKYAGGEVPDDSRFAATPGMARRYLTDDDLAAADRLTAFAADHGHTLLDLAVSWLAGQDTVATVITGASRPSQVQANVAAASWALTDDQRDEVDRLLS